MKIEGTYEEVIKEIELNRSIIEEQLKNLDQNKLRKVTKKEYLNIQHISELYKNFEEQNLSISKINKKLKNQVYRIEDKKEFNKAYLNLMNKKGLELFCLLSFNIDKTKGVDINIEFVRIV